VPGFSLIKNSVIKPLLIASERIVEQIMPEREPYKLKMAPEYEDNLDRNIETTTKHDTISLISGEDQEDKKFRKQMHKLNLQEDNYEFFDQPDKTPVMKKKRFKELQKFSLDEDFMAPSPTSSQGSMMKKREQKSDTKILSKNIINKAA